MAKKRIVEKEPEFILNAREPALGIGILKKKSDGTRTFEFVRGGERTFKDAYCALYIKPAVVVSSEVRKKLKPPGPPATPRAAHTDLEKQILERREDPDAYLVYADWLQQHQDPRGELIALQHQRAAAPRDKQLAAREQALLAQHTTYFVPESLGAALKIPKRGGPRVDVTWRFGFVDELRLAKDTTPSWGDIDLPAIVRETLSHPSGKFLRKLVLGAPGGHPWSYLPQLAEIARAKHDGLEELVVGDAKPIEMEPSWARAGDLGPAVRALPRLKKLVVKAGTLRFGAKLKHDALEELQLSTGQLSSRDLDSLLAGSLPQLHTLDVTCDGVELLQASYNRLAAGAAMPRLRHLALRGTRRTLALIDALLAAPWLPQLETLVLDRNDLDAAGASRVIGRHAAFEHLRILDLSGDRIPPDLAAELVHTLPNSQLAARARFAITEHDVIARSPDRESVGRARKLADPKKWLELGFDPVRERVWGEYEGTEHYDVWVHTGRRFSGGCDCASPKNPCKHTLALALLAARQHPFVERAVSDRLVRRATTSRPSYGTGDHGYVERDPYDD